MCGRFALYAPSPAIRNHFDLQEEVVVPPRYNIAPGQDVAVIPGTEQGSRLYKMHWGFLPEWSRDRRDGYRMINARSETVHEKSSFKEAFRTSRCLIPANGFYEWRKLSGRKDKQPYFIQMADSSLFAFAGLWSSWTDRSCGKTLLSCTILTTAANALLSEVHDRMPVMLRRDHYGLWLHPDAGTDALRSLFTPFDPELMTLYPVSTRCNNAENDCRLCIERRKT